MSYGSQISDMLKEHSIFSSIDDKIIKKISRDSRCILSFSKVGEDVIKGNEHSHALGLILEGTVLVYRKGGGNPILLQRLNKGKLFGASTLFSPSGDYLTELKAGSDCTVYFLPFELVRELIVESPSFALNYISFLSGRIRFLNERLSELSAPTATQKLASYLIKGNDRIAVSKVQLASALGIGRASLYRSLDELSEMGLIASDGKNINVIDREGLISLI